MATKSSGKGAGRGGARPGAGYPRGVPRSPIVRERIRQGVLVARLHGIAEGTIKGTPEALGVQVRAGLGLLRKVMPDLAATDLTSKGESIVVERLSFKHTPRETAHVQEATPGEAVAQVNTEVARGD